MNNNNSLMLYDDQSIINKKLNNFYTLMFFVANGTKINTLIHCCLIFLEDIQLIYFAFFNENVLSMNEKLRSLISYFALDNIPFETFRILHCIFCVLYIISALLIIYNVLFAHPEKIKENYTIKYLRYSTIVFNLLILPAFTHMLCKAVIPKDDKFAAFPDVTFMEKNSLLTFVSLISILFYFLLQFTFYPLLYITPTPFEKKNSLCQTYSLINLKYNFEVFVLVAVTQVCKTYAPKVNDYIFIALLLFMLINYCDLSSTQSYYNKHINNFRAGMWIMILMMCVIELIGFIFGIKKSFMSIIVMAIGFCSFFVGFALNRSSYNKRIDAIYKRYKAKKIEDKEYYKRENGIEHSETSSSENETRSSSASSNDENDENNEEKLISVDSGESSDDDKKSEDSDGEGSEGGDSNSSLAISDRISERISLFSTADEILTTKILNEPVVVYANVNEFELACRFLWNNETREAFQLMKELYDESLKQFPNNPFVLTYYSYYLLYINQRLSKEDKDIVLQIEKKQNKYDIEIKEEEDNENEGNENDEGNENYNGSDYGDSNYNGSNIIEDEDEENENEEALDEDQLNANNPDYLLLKALNGKLSFLGKYFVRYLIFNIKEKRKEEKDYYKKEALERLVTLQHEAVEKHLTILNILKNFFNNIKYINMNHQALGENFSMDEYLEASFNLKKETLGLYQKIISEYPDEKSTYQLYTLFMTDIVNQLETDKYMLTEGDSFMALNAPNMGEKKKTSLSSFGVSNAGGSSVGESESKKRKLLKSNMIHSFTDKSKRLSKLVIILFIATIIIYVSSTIYSFIHISHFNTGIKHIRVLEDMNYNLLNMMVRFRMLSTSTAMGDISQVLINQPTLIGYLDNIEDKYIPILKKYSLQPKSTYPVVVYNVDSINGKTRSQLAHFNGYELIRNIVVWGRDLTNTPPEEWLELVLQGVDIIQDYRIRMFAENFQYYYTNVIDETMNIMYEDEIASKNIEIYIIYVFTGCLVVLATFINIFGVTQLSRNSKNLYDKTMKMFKLLLRGSINDIISKFEISVESITETYDISADNKKNKYKNIDRKNVFKTAFKKLKGFIINGLLIGSILLLTVPVIIKDKSIVSNLDYLLLVGKRKDMIINMSIFSFEVILQDGRFYVPGLSESYLNKEIEKLEKIQQQLYRGELGLQSTTKMEHLDDLIINKDCRFDDNRCETIEEMPDIGFTKNAIKMHLNEFVDEMIERFKVILKSSKLKDFKTYDHMYKNIYDNTRLFMAFQSSDFYFELVAIEHLFAGLEKFDTILYDMLFESIRSTMLYLIIIIFVGIGLISLAFLIIYRMIKSTNENLNELVNLIFIIPPSTINMIPQFKRFIETGGADEEE